MSKVTEIIEDLRNIEDLAGPAQEVLVSGDNIKTVGGQSLLGAGDIELTTVNNTLTSTSTTEALSAAQGKVLEDGKQATLISGTNIKTIGGNSILGSGDIPASVFGGQADFQEFTTSGTWTKPDWCNYVYVECVGGGESGGAANTIYNQTLIGAGGLPGQVVKKIFNAEDISSTVNVVIGAGGARRVVTGYIKIILPAPGGDSSFGTYLTAPGGKEGITIFNTTEFEIVVSRRQDRGDFSGDNGILYYRNVYQGNKVNTPAGGGLSSASNKVTSFDGFTSVNYGDGGGGDNFNGEDGGFPGGGGGGAAGLDSSPYTTVRTSGKGGDGRVRVWCW